MPAAFVSLPLKASRFQYRKGLLPGHTYCRFSAWWRDLADSDARLGLTDQSLKMQGRVVENISTGIGVAIGRLVFLRTLCSQQVTVQEKQLLP